MACRPSGRLSRLGGTRGAHIRRRTPTNPNAYQGLAGVTLPRDRRRASMKPEQAPYLAGTRESGRGQSGKESFEACYPNRAGVRLYNMQWRIACLAEARGSTSLPDGVFPCISEDPMLPFVLFYSVNNPS
jgi:hypothetical protein